MRAVKFVKLVPAAQNCWTGALLVTNGWEVHLDDYTVENNPTYRMIVVDDDLQLEERVVRIVEVGGNDEGMLICNAAHMNTVTTSDGSVYADINTAKTFFTMD